MKRQGKVNLKTPSVFLKTYGCQMNFRDSEFVTGILLKDGFGMADSIDKADVILFNSCSVRKHAEERLFSNIASLSGLKKTRPNLVIGLIGCTAQSYKEKALERLPILDLVCGPGDESDLPKIIKDILKTRCPIIATEKVDEKRPELRPGYRGSDFKTYVSISEGCSNFCSYCIVPYVRGRERSRDLKEIIKEIEDLAARGFKEITLIGQNVNSYRDCPRRGLSLNKRKEDDFVRLLEKINKINGIKRIRFLTSHPRDASMDLFKAMRNLEKVCERLHLPLQSGSNRILKLMNRGYTQERYLRLIQDYRRLVPGGSITTDIIVGFPSETEEDFEDTLTLMKEIGFDSAFIFKYSPRSPAKSATSNDDVPKEMKEERLKTLLDLQCEISRMRNESMKGKVVEVLVDGQNKKSITGLTGRTRTDKVAVFGGGRELIGELVDIEIESVTPHTLIGKILLLLIFALNFYLFTFTFCLSYAEPEKTSIARVEKLFLEGRYEKASPEIDKLIDSGSTRRDEIYYLKGLSELKTNRFKDARGSFEKVISKFPRGKRLFDAYVGIGDSYFLEGKVEDALRIYQDILSRFPDEKNIPAVYYRIGTCFKRKGSDEKAKEHFDKVRVLAPMSFEAKMVPSLDEGKNNFSVQVGYFESKRNAERLVATLINNGFDSYVEASISSGETFYRVKVGRDLSKSEAENLAVRLKRDGYSTKISE